VTWVQFSTYVISGLMAAFAGIAITMLSGSGNAEIGGPMTLNSITAVVIGGNAMSGGVGGVAGPIMGAITLGIIQNIISFADKIRETLVVHPSSSRIGRPGIVTCSGDGHKRISISPPVAALSRPSPVPVIGLVAERSAVTCVARQALNILRPAVFLGVIAAGQMLVIVAARRDDLRRDCRGDGDLTPSSSTAQMRSPAAAGRAGCRCLDRLHQRRVLPSLYLPLS
jgi:hypothetical protein